MPTYPKIFVCYRRADAATEAVFLYDQLVERFGEDNVFLDIEVIADGRDFRRVIEEQVSACNYLLAVIGKTWLTAVDSNGNRRLDDPKDTVRIEIVTALERNVTVIPVLWHNVSMPKPSELPLELADLTYRLARSMDLPSRQHDVNKLIDNIERLEKKRLQAETQGEQRRREERTQTLERKTPAIGGNPRGLGPRSGVAYRTRRVLRIASISVAVLGGIIALFELLPRTPSNPRDQVHSPKNDPDGGGPDGGSIGHIWPGTSTGQPDPQHGVQPPVIFRGRVVTEAGAALPNVDVLAVDEKENLPFTRVVTGSDGRYRIDLKSEYPVTLAFFFNHVEIKQVRGLSPNRDQNVDVTVPTPPGPSGPTSAPAPPP
ncbi:MAG TPA: TIR domain-containing protein [Planctomycetaceae bacterium]|jgi:hypothetical protein|nr:TIR domain-containing protein [Planctomycetaceae bacterium]